MAIVCDGNYDLIMVRVKNLFKTKIMSIEYSNNTKTFRTCKTCNNQFEKKNKQLNRNKK